MATRRYRRSRKSCKYGKLKQKTKGRVCKKRFSRRKSKKRSKRRCKHGKLKRPTKRRRCKKRRRSRKHKFSHCV